MLKMILILCLLILFSCNKEKNNLLKTSNISGYIIDAGNDSTINGVEVILSEFNGNKLERTFTSFSSNTGLYSFKEIPIYENNTYSIEVKSYTDYSIDSNGYSTKNFEFSGLDRVELEKNKISDTGKILVYYTFKSLFRVMPSNYSFNQGDTLKMYFLQKTLHKNIPTKIWEINTVHYTPEYWEFPGSINQYWSGKWHIFIEKYKNGIWSHVQDSIFIGKGETKEYIIPW